MEFCVATGEWSGHIEDCPCRRVDEGDMMDAVKRAYDKLTAERDALNQRVERLVAVGDKMASHPGHDIVGGTCMKCCAYDHAAVAAEWRVAREAGNGEGT